jgi:hypothetical protein
VRGGVDPAVEEVDREEAIDGAGICFEGGGSDSWGGIEVVGRPKFGLGE